MTDQMTLTETHRVLVAEDDPHDQMLFIMAAEDANASIKLEFMPNGEEFLTELRRMAAADDLPAMAVLDMRMPRMSGHDVLDVLGREPAICPAEVGVFSTSHRHEDVVESLTKGAAWHEVKPSKFEELVAFIRRIDQRCHELGQGS
ncbi:MAG: response regulator [Actinomycetota bacterium]